MPLNDSGITSFSPAVNARPMLSVKSRDWPSLNAVDAPTSTTDSRLSAVTVTATGGSVRPLPLVG